MRHYALLLLVAILAQPPLAARAQSVSAEDSAFFESKVRPVLFDRCFSCHGDKLQKGGVRLDSRAELLKDASDRKIVTSADPEASALIRAIRYDGKIKMPPGGKLTQESIDALTTWVKRGAPWPNSAPVPAYTITAAQRQFWAFQPIRKPRLPDVKRAAWVHDPIDRFILAGLEAKHLAPAAPADKRTLIRRATYDLTGLPPTPAEVNAFLVDSSPDAYSKVIDRLLASPRYGERWGRHWLDVARYADSADARGLGSEGDISEAWRYRDWVVNAFNSDMGYDRFVMNQVAGDLLPNESDPHEPLNVPGTIATGLLAIGNWGNGDADKEKLVTDIADDQVDIVSRGFMGVTLGCARCHDHKFDPFPTKDYYGMAGIFFSSHILPRLTPKGQGEVMLRIPLETGAMKAQRAAYEAQVAGADADLQKLKSTSILAYARSMLPQTAAYLSAAMEYSARPAAMSGTSIADYASQRKLSPILLRRWENALYGGDYPLMTVSSKDTAGVSGVFQWRGMADCPNLLVNTTAKPVSITTLTVPAQSVAVHPGPANGVAVEWVSPVNGTVQVTGKVTDADPNCGDGIAWAIDHRSALAVSEVASGDFPNGGMQEFSKGANAAGLNTVHVQQGDRLQLVVLPKANYNCDTTIVTLNIKQLDAPSRTDWDLTRDMMQDPIRSNPRADGYGHPDVWRFADMADVRREDRMGGRNGELLAAFVKANTGKPAGQIEAAAAEFQKGFDAADAQSPFRPAMNDLSPLPADVKSQIASAETHLADLKKAAPPPPGIANGIQEGGIPDSPTAGIHDVRVHIRGRYDRLGDLAPRHFPIILAGDNQPPITSGSGRLELAKWLVSDTHPLTARVIVNRIWQHHFGEGIVRTPSNFGMLGERPTHPELLDWLASEFRRRPGGSDPYACGWSMKKLHRIIMLSSAYRQASTGDPGEEKADPDNRLFGRFNRQRLEAEAIRDTLLAAAGTLDLKMGGMAVRDLNETRRTLYVMTIRSDRSGYGPLFDTADPTSTADHRVVSTVAPQALFLMNSPFVAAQARALTRRVAREGGNSDVERINWLYELLYSRPPSASEVRIGQTYLQKYLSNGVVQASTGSAPDRETRAWESYCSILLCTNELIFIN